MSCSTGQKYLLDVQCTYTTNESWCEVQLTAADNTNIVHMERICFDLLLKTDLSEPYLDVAAGEVYLPYKKPQA